MTPEQTAEFERDHLPRIEAEGWSAWVCDEADRLAVLAGYRFDIERAERVRQFFERFLVLTSGKRFAGKPFMLQAWQWERIIGPLFGWVDDEGRRRYRKAYIQVPKKNGKTQLLAGLSLYLLLGDGEPSPEVYSAATSRDQAGILYRAAAAMVRQSPAVAKHLEPLDSTKRITLAKGAGFYSALSRDAKSGDGFDASAVIIDELHRFQNSDLIDALEYSGAARDDPLTIIITTAGSALETPCGREYRYARKVRDSQHVDLSYLPVIYEADHDADPLDEAQWYQANPSLGTILDVADFRAEAERAVADPVRLSAFKRLRLNIWADAADAYIPADRWRGCSAPVDLEAMEGRPCYAGLDLSSTTDTTALVLAFADPDDDQWLGLHPLVYLPQARAADGEREDQAPYRAWHDAGLMTLTPGDVVDYEQVIDDIAQLHERFSIRELAVDPWNAEAVSQQLAKLGIEVTKVRQGYSISPATKELKRLAYKGKIAHGGHPVLTWQIANAVAAQDHRENLTLNKAKSGGRIDAAVAAVMAVHAARFGLADPSFTSVYSAYAEDRDELQAEAPAPAFESVYAAGDLYNEGGD
jgi:phage terminase large subunit-like protein